MFIVLLSFSSSLAKCIFKWSSTVSINCHNKKPRYKTDMFYVYCYVLHTVLLVMILLLIITTTCYYYAKHRPKLKNILLSWQYKNGK